MKLYSVYPHLVSISYSNQRTVLSDEDVSRLEELEGSSPEEIASAFFLLSAQAAILFLLSAQTIIFFFLLFTPSIQRISHPEAN